MIFNAKKHVSLKKYLSIYLSIYLSVYLSICLSICLSVYPAIIKMRRIISVSGIGSVGVRWTMVKR